MSKRHKESVKELRLSALRKELSKLYKNKEENKEVIEKIAKQIAELLTEEK